MSDKINILYCIVNLDRGGTEKQLIALIERIDRTRFTPLLCTTQPSGLDLASLECEFLELDFDSFASVSVWSKVALLRSFISRHGVNIVQTFFPDPTLLTALAVPRRGGPCKVCSFRDMGYWRTRWRSLALRFAYRRFDLFLANSQAVSRNYQQQDGVPAPRCEVIYNGVSVPGGVEPNPEARALARRGRVVGIVANLNRRVKRVDLFIRAAGIVAQSIRDVAFVIVGDGALKPELERLAAEHGVSERTHFVGRVPDVWPWVSGFDIGVISSDSEGFSNSILEYMALGVPTVATRAGGNPEIIRDGVTGFLVECGNAEQLASAVSRLLDDDDLHHRVAEHGRECVRADFSMGAYVRNHEQLYASIMAGEVPA